MAGVIHGEKQRHETTDDRDALLTGDAQTELWLHGSFRGIGSIPVGSGALFGQFLQHLPIGTSNVDDVFEML